MNPKLENKSFCYLDTLILQVKKQIRKYFYIFIVVFSWSNYVRAHEDGNLIKLKLTFAEYFYTSGDYKSEVGQDANLRISSERYGNSWVGAYKPPKDASTQARVGWDKTIELTSLWRVIPTAQIASGGSISGGSNLELGEDVIGGVGLSRTNLKNYTNLIFDPADSWTIYLGKKLGLTDSVVFTIVQDNRLYKDQRHVHLVYKGNFSAKTKFMFDILHKSGSVDGISISKYGANLGLEANNWQFKLAYDPNVNFSDSTMIRAIVAYKF